MELDKKATELIQKHGKVCKFCEHVFVSMKKNILYCSDSCRAAESKVKYKQAKADGKFDHVTREKFLIFQRDRFRCIYCGKSSIEDNVKLQVEHINPKKNGGDNAAMNLVTSCLECNMSKGARLLSSEEMVRITSVVMERNLSCGINNTKQINLSTFGN